MKILWIINTIIPDIARELGLEAGNREGWLQGAFNGFSLSEQYKLSVAFPVKEMRFQGDNLNNGMVLVKGIECYPFVENLDCPECYDVALESSIKEIIERVKPDILHIFGTEFPHALAASKVFNCPEKTLVGIQGLCSVIARDYLALIPDEVAKEVTFRDFIKKDSIKDQQRKFFIRGDREQELIKSVNNITGRTEFDKKTTAAINPLRTYYHMNESMRRCFYDMDEENCVWKLEKAEPYSIFLGQGDYPIKGMHFLLEAAGELIKKYPKLQINVAGNSIISYKSLKDKIKTPAYGKYLRKLISQNNLEGHITILGSLTGLKMREQYIKSSVFVCPSYVENSPNTLAEAMLLGVPVVTSDAGGITSMISEAEGLIFKRGDVKRLISAIERIWNMENSKDDSQTKKLEKMCENARKRAQHDYSICENNKTLLNIYDSIFEA